MSFELPLTSICMHQNYKRFKLQGRNVKTFDTSAAEQGVFLFYFAHPVITVVFKGGFRFTSVYLISSLSTFEIKFV